ncbi:chalcone isomerase family protein [Roseomonas sp. CCTCC AB2023176]|uniref:chalcone isomerase family protein n=1 Tax=Roseomonas sp. CCTCC AB2023176 TaxID=3342640 RepID=UPI0035D8414F
MTRRELLLLAATPEVEFPPALDAAGTRLVLNGTARRTWSILRIEVYRAALYLPAPSNDAAVILGTSAPRLVEARYRRDVPLDSVVAAWEATAGAPLPAAFRAWLRPIAAGDVERQFFRGDGVVLSGPGRPEAFQPGMAFARRLLATWIGMEADPDVRRGLLGGGA